MKNLIKTEFRVYAKNKKMQLIVVLILASSILLSFYVTSQHVQDIRKIGKAERDNLASVLATISEKDRLTNKNNNLYELLIKQERLASTKNMTIIMGMDDVYLKKEHELLAINKEIVSDPSRKEEFAYLPSLNEVKRDLTVNNYLQKKKYTPSFDLKSGSRYVLYFLQTMGTILALAFFLLTCDVLIEDRQHPSLVKGYPISFSKNMLARGVVLGLLVLSTLLIATALAFFTMSFRFNQGNLAYPATIFFNGQHHVVSIFLYMLLFVVYALFLFAFVFTLSIVLNLLTNNMYITLFIESFLLVLSFLFAPKDSVTNWLPHHFFNVTAILNGDTSQTLASSHIDIVAAIIVLFVSTIVLMGIVYQFRTRLEKHVGRKSA